MLKKPREKEKQNKKFLTTRARVQSGAPTIEAVQVRRRTENEIMVSLVPHQANCPTDESLTPHPVVFHTLATD